MQGFVLEIAIKLDYQKQIDSDTLIYYKEVSMLKQFVWKSESQFESEARVHTGDNT